MALSASFCLCDDNRVLLTETGRIAATIASTVDAVDGRGDYGEVRIKSVGMLDGTVALAMVHTMRGNFLRLISARVANRKERRRYEEALRQGIDN